MIRRSTAGIAKLGLALRATEAIVCAVCGCFRTNLLPVHIFHKLNLAGHAFHNVAAGLVDATEQIFALSQNQSQRCILIGVEFISAQRCTEDPLSKLPTAPTNCE